MSWRAVVLRKGCEGAGAEGGFRPAPHTMWLWDPEVWLWEMVFFKKKLCRWLLSNPGSRLPYRFIMASVQGGCFLWSVADTTEPGGVGSSFNSCGSCWVLSEWLQSVSVLCLIPGWAKLASWLLGTSRRSKIQENFEMTHYYWLCVWWDREVIFLLHVKVLGIKTDHFQVDMEPKL